MADRCTPAVCRCGCRVPRLAEQLIESPHEPCCCCEYNPFYDNAKESEMYDLPFALRKLAVMKCQMRKWRMERLQLESENRSLKQTLSSYGTRRTRCLDTGMNLFPFFFSRSLSYPIFLLRSSHSSRAKSAWSLRRVPLGK